ncbi:MAG TPA: GNAT family N-acetyltransferase [Bacteroidia bacterium]|nr:GNAT family N-acetyltransferase [Bacteroidia bacterium]
MLTLNFTPFPILTTERLVLRQFTKDDLPEIYLLRTDKKVSKYITRPDFKTMEDAEAYIAKMTGIVNNNESVIWGITKKGDDKVMGSILLWHFRKEDYRAEVGYEMRPEFWGQGIMSEAMVAIVDYGFNTLKLHSIEAIVNPDNAASIKVLTKNEFVREAYFKENYFHEGVFRDTGVYSLLNPAPTPFM